MTHWTFKFFSGKQSFFSGNVHVPLSTNHAARRTVGSQLSSTLALAISFAFQRDKTDVELRELRLHVTASVILEPVEDLRCAQDAARAQPKILPPGGRPSVSSQRVALTSRNKEGERRRPASRGSSGAAAQHSPVGASSPCWMEG